MFTFEKQGHFSDISNIILLNHCDLHEYVFPKTNTLAPVTLGGPSLTLD